MSAKREYRKSELTPEQRADIAAVREQYQREKPSLEQALAASGVESAMPLGEVLFIHAMLAALRQERERQGISATELADRVGIDPAALSRLENGKHGNPTLRTVDRIATALGKVVRWSLEDAPSAPSAPHTCPPASDGHRATHKPA
jgi:DNA-binding Xre family transcriptional regulator